jgi:hypothetical protein
MSTTKLQLAQGYLRAWIANRGGFDLDDVADRQKCTAELKFVRNALFEILEDEQLFEVDYEIYLEEQKTDKSGNLISDWLKELTDRYFG